MGVRGGEALFMKLMFKHFLRRGAYTRAEFEALFRRSAFDDFTIEKRGTGFSITLEKAPGAVSPPADAPRPAA